MAVLDASDVLGSAPFDVLSHTWGLRTVEREHSGIGDMSLQEVLRRHDCHPGVIAQPRFVEVSAGEYGILQIGIWKLRKL